MQAERTLAMVKEALGDMKAVDVQELDVEAITTITSRMLICTGTSQRHVKALADTVIQAAKDAGQRPLGVEGIDQGEWVLVDLGEVVVHIMQAQTRALYQLEKLWSAPEQESATPRH